MTTYLDNATTTTLDPRVLEVMLEAFGPDVGDPDSRTHAFGRRARELVDRARRQVAELVSARRSEVIFTSGGTEAANLGVLGLGPRAAQEGRMHVVSALNEHSAVLEPLRVLEEQGFEVTRLSPGRGGWVEPEKLAGALRPDTFLVSLMHVNDVTGVINPLVDYAEVLQDHEAWFHTDAAQGFGKDIKALRNPRIDLISVSGHKIHAPAGVGALIARRRDRTPPPLAPLIASLGLYIVLENLVGILFGTGVRVVDLDYGIFFLGPVFFTSIHLWQVGSFVILAGGLALFLRRTRYGKAILAMTDDPDMARSIDQIVADFF